MIINLPTKAKLVAIVKEHSQEHSGLFTIILRIFLYTIGVLTSCYIAETYFNDTYFANVCVFLPIATVIEMIWHMPKACQRWRMICYILCILGMILAASTLLHQGKTCQTATGCACYKVK